MKTKNCCHPLSLLAGLAMMAPSLAVAQVGYILTDLGVIAPSTTSNARGINNAGQIAFSTRYILPGVGQTPILVPTLSGTTNTTSLSVINQSGVVGGTSTNSAGVVKAVLWTGSGGLTFMGDLGASFRSEVLDVNESNVAVGIARTGTATSTGRAALFSNGVAVNLAANLPSTSNRASAITNSGMVVGQARLVGGTVTMPVIFDGFGGATGLGLLPTYDRGNALGINENGTIVGIVSRLTADTQIAVKWDVSTLLATAFTRPIGSKGSYTAGAVNFNGDAVGGGTLDNSISRSMVYQGNTGYVLQNLVLNRPDGWVFRTTPGGINDAGVIVGDAEVDGQLRGYMLTPAPGQGSVISGTLNIQNFVGPRFTPNFLFSLVPVGGGTTRTYPETGLSATGQFLLMTDAVGTYDLFIEGSTFLRRKVAAGLVLANGASFTGITNTVFNGDADLSGEVDAADIDYVIQNFGLTSSDLGFFENIAADLDGSNEIDAADIDIAIANFGATDE